MSAEAKLSRKQEARDAKQGEATAASVAKRNARFVAPKEPAAGASAVAAEAKRKKPDDRSATQIAAALKDKDSVAKKRRARGGAAA